MKLILCTLLIILGSCVSKNPEPESPAELYSGTYYVRCTSTARDSYMYYTHIQELTISAGDQEKMRNFQTEGDSLSIVLTGDTFSFVPNSDSSRFLSGGGHFSKKSGTGFYNKDSIIYQRLYTYYKNGVSEYEYSSDCGGPRLK